MATNPYPPYNPKAHALELMGWTGDDIAKLLGITPPGTGVTMGGDYVPNPQGLGYDFIPPDNPAGARELWRGLDPETGRPKPWMTRAEAEALPQYTNTGRYGGEFTEMAGLEQSRPGPVDITRQLPKSPRHGMLGPGAPPSKVVKMRLAWDEMFTKQEQGKIAKGSKAYFGPIQREYDEVLEIVDFDDSGSIRKHPYGSRGPLVGRGENIHKMAAHPFNPSAPKDLMKIIPNKKIVGQLMKFGKSFGKQALQMMLIHPRIPG
jgi:hypothetical protein